MSELDSIRKAKQEHQAWLDEQPGIQGVGVGVDASANPCLKVFTRLLDRETKTRIIERLSNVHFEFVESGPFMKQ